jgi:hypothetical protein
MKMPSQKIIRLILFLLFVLSSIFLGTMKGQESKISRLPSQILFNGYLTDKAGTPYNNSYYKFTIFIYDSPDSKLPIYSETHDNVLINNGTFSLTIGKGDDKKLNDLKFDKKYYIGIKLNDEAEMQQRLEFGSTAYSLAAKYANTVADGSITTEKIADNSITDDKIQNFSIKKIVNLPSSITSYEDLKNKFNLTGSDYEWWTTFGNFIYGPERHFLGTRNDRNFVIKTNEIQRMRFSPGYYIVLGTVKDSVNFEVFGYSIFDYVYIKGNLGVGVDPALAKVHIKSPLGKNPLRIDYHNSSIFTIDTLGRVVITSSVSVGDTDEKNYALEVKGATHGVGVKVAGKSNGANNYVSFWDDSGMVGRIEGQNAGDYASQPQSITTDAFLASLIVAEGVAVVAMLWPLPIPSEPADIVRCAADIAEITFNMIWDYSHLGVTYESAAGDYAEWLERKDVNELMTAGDIVVVNGGKITKNTNEAEQFMAVSTSPIILGNMQENDRENKFEKIAFMGQVPIKVRGAVNSGDYILPSGLNDGTGIALAPDLMTIDEYGKIVGRAWSSSSNESLKMVNVYVGVHSNDIGQLLQRINSGKNIAKGNGNILYRDILMLRERLNKLKNYFYETNKDFTNALDHKSVQ